MTNFRTAKCRTLQSKRATFHRHTLTLLLMSSGIAGCATNDDSDDHGKAKLSTSAAAINGSTSVDVTNSTKLPEAAVGQVVIPNCGSLSGTLIKRNLVLTAAHAFCSCIDPTDTNPQTRGTPVNGLSNPTKFLGANNNSNPPKAAASFVLTSVSAPTAISIPIASASVHYNKRTCSGVRRGARTDVAVLTLSRNATNAESPGVVDVETSASIRDYTQYGFGELFLPGPLHLVGWGGGPDGPSNFGDFGSYRNLATLTADEPLRLDFDCGDAAGCSSAARLVFDTTNESGARPWKGDSGSPILYYPNGFPGPARILGVYASEQIPNSNDETQGLDEVQERRYSPTFDSGDANNGAFIRQFFNDADEDGVNDDVDNCPPSRCSSWDISKCANPDQKDEDDDKVGDVCDNCAPSRCTFLFGAGNEFRCANPIVPSTTPGVPSSQMDSDLDGFGDACDSCPGTPNAIDSDSDGDGVENACDNCKSVQATLKYCRTSADCDSGVCHKDGIGYKGCFNTGGVCLTDADCGGIPGMCLGNDPADYGRCEHPKDRDLDGLGDACDVCPTTDDRLGTGNSNSIAEDFTGTSPRNDICDPVPVVRTDISATIAGAQTIPLRYNLSASAIIGRDSGTGPTSFIAESGYRHCSCIDGTGDKVDETTCLKTICSRSAADFDNSNSGVTSGGWRRVTLSFSALSGGNPTPFLRGATSVRTFSNAIHCSSGVGATCQGGSLGEQFGIHWDLASDLVAGAGSDEPIPTWVDENDPATLHTTGIFWGHVKTDSSATHPYASSRDSSAPLRETYLYFQTPPPVDYSIDISKFPTLVNSCVGAPCGFTFRPDWLFDPDPVFHDHSPLESIHTPARILVSQDGRLGAIRNPGTDVLDVTSAMSPSVVATLADSSQMFLTPVEGGARGALQGLHTQFVAMPRTWTSSSSVLEVVSSSGKLNVRLRGDHSGELPSGGILPQSSILNSVGSPGSPTERSDYLAALAGSERAVYMVGGSSPTGGNYSEIWRYGLDSHSWEQIRFGAIPSVIPSQDIDNGTPMASVKAVAYDDQHHWLFVLDEHRADVPFLKNRIRLTRWNITGGDRNVLFDLPRIGRLDRIGLVVSEGGSVFLTGQLRGFLPGWIAYRLDVSASGALTWKGWLLGPGKILDTPFNTSDGVYLPTAVGNTSRLVQVDRQSLSPGGCSDL